MHWARGDGVVDDTHALQAALDVSDNVQFDGLYRISDALILRHGQRVRLSARTRVWQIRPDRNAFVATDVDDILISLGSGEIRGAGGWSRLWTGNQGWEGFRGIRLVGYRIVRIVGPGRLTNWASAAIDVTDCADVECRDLTISGTHRFGQSLVRENNFQNGIYITNDRRWGAAEAVTITGCDISGVAQGCLARGTAARVRTDPDDYRQ